MRSLQGSHQEYLLGSLVGSRLDNQAVIHLASHLYSLLGSRRDSQVDNLHVTLLLHALDSLLYRLLANLRLVQVVNRLPNHARDLRVIQHRLLVNRLTILLVNR